MTATTPLDGSKHCIGIDLGGTHIRVALWRRADLITPHLGIEPLDSIREPVGSNRAPRAIANRLSALLLRLGQPSTTIPVGLGLAAMLKDNDGGVRNAPHLGWRDIDFGALWKKHRARGYNVSLYNDVDAIAWAEYRCSPATPQDTAFAVFVGTGVGGGLIVNDKLLSGPHGGSAGEVGHVKVEVGPDAEPCRCGQRGCLEAYVGGHYLLQQAQLLLPRDSVAFQSIGPESVFTVSAIDNAAKRGDTAAQTMLSNAGNHLGVAIANVVTVLSPHWLFLGGGVLANAPFMRSKLLEACQRTAEPIAYADLQVAVSQLGQHAGTLGAALLAHAEASFRVS